MSIEAIGFLTIAAGTVSLFLGLEFAFMAFVPMTLLGSSAAVLLGGSGNIQPAHLMLGFLAVAVSQRSNLLNSALRSLTFPREGFWLAGMLAYGIVGAFFLPRVFAGATEVNAIGSTEYGASVMLVPLGPTSGNLTQSIYFAADFACFMVTLAYASTESGFETVTMATLLYCSMNVVFAAADIATSYTNTEFILSFIRNAAYQLHVEEVAGGTKRIVGSFTEASSFAYATIGSLGFTTWLLLVGRWRHATGLLSLLSLALLLLSTSSTAYVATPILLFVLYLRVIARVIRVGVPASTLFLLVLAPMMSVLAMLAVSLNHTALDTVRNMLDVTLLDKASSQSGIERAQWNQTALRNFFATFGMGGGLGSIRASSFPLAVLSNMGIVGFVGFAGFIASLLSPVRGRNGAALAEDVRSAARIACIGLLVAACISGALVDLGLPFYVFAALACAVPGKARALAPVREPFHSKAQGTRLRAEKRFDHDHDRRPGRPSLHARRKRSRISCRSADRFRRAPTGWRRSRPSMPPRSIRTRASPPRRRPHGRRHCSALSLHMG